MRARLLSCLTLVCLLSAGCSPARKCGGALYYDAQSVSCRPCPMGARFEAGTCVCSDDREFKNDLCIARAGEPSDAAVQDAAASASSCDAYCQLVHVCLAQNELAQAVIPTVIAGLHADMPSACLQTCAAAGGDGQLGACVAEGREAAACENDDTQAGMRGAITLLADCARAHPDDPLRGVLCEGLVQSPLVNDQINFCD